MMSGTTAIGFDRPHFGLRQISHHDVVPGIPHVR
jgi:hypothetical protein